MSLGSSRGDSCWGLPSAHADPVRKRAPDTVPSTRFPTRPDVPVAAACLFGYAEATTTEAKAAQARHTLPADVSLEDAVERLCLLARIEQGLPRQ